MFKAARLNSPKPAWAAVIALGLAGCGGGGGVASLPPPPATPTPTPASFSISAPAGATTGSAPVASVFATQDGPNFTTGPAAGTVFPALQTLLVLDANNVHADSTGNAASGTATVEAGQLKFAAPVFQGTPQFSGYANLDWTRVGYWGLDGGDWDYGGSSRGVFVAGYETPAGAVPTTGTATYTGLAQGSVYYGVNEQTTEASLSGNASFTANFGTRNVSGSLTGMTAGGAPWNDVAFNSTITGNAFSGTTSVSSAPGGAASLGSNATGTVEGRFFGPSAQEAGAVWTLFDGMKSAIGTLAGKQP